jgi:HEAT repeat protein
LLLAVLLGYLIIRKAEENRMAAKVNALRERYYPLMYRYVTKGTKSRHLLPDHNPLKFEALERLLGDFSQALQEESVRRRIREYAELHFAPTYRKRLNGRAWSRRMNALYRIDEFGITVLTDQLLRLYTEKARLTPAEWAQLYRIYASAGCLADTGLLLRPRTVLPDLVLRELFVNMDERSFQAYVETFGDCPYALQANLLDVIGIQKKETYIDFLLDLLAHDNAEIRIRSLKALSRFNRVPYRETLINHAASEHWEERMMAARLFGSMREERFLPALRLMMSDSTWWVRRVAGSALMQFRSGEQLLRQIAETDKDAFARDMALECLERGKDVAAAY